jgi:hypothetical protein
MIPNTKKHKQTLKRNNFRSKNNTPTSPIIPEREKVTLESIYDFMVSFSNNTEKRFEKIDERFEKIDERFEKIDERFEGIDRQLHTINKTIAHMKIDIEKFHNYMKTESTFQEKRDTQTVKSLYSLNHPTSIVTTLFIDNVYNRKGKIITELDGLLLVSDIPLDIPDPIPNKIDNGRQAVRMEYIRSLNVVHPIDPTSELFHPSSMAYIIIESKHGLTKSKLDIKLNQFLQMKQLFTDISNQPDDHPPYYTEMVDNLLSETHLSLSDIGKPSLFMILSSDDLSDELHNYIQAIYFGIPDAKTYDELIQFIFFSDRYLIKGLFKQIIHNPRIPITLKDIIKMKSPMSDVRMLFSRADEWSHYLGMTPQNVQQMVEEYLIPFSDVQHSLDQLKGSIGILQLHNIFMPRLFAIETTKSGAGWTPDAPSAYEPSESGYPI